MVKIQVLQRDNNQPDDNALVCLLLDGLPHGHTPDQWTDDSGYVDFNVDPGSGVICVNSDKVFSGPLESYMVVYSG